MYFVFESEMVYWHKKLLKAKIVGEAPDLMAELWSADPLAEPLAELKFKVNSKAPLLDNYYNAPALDLYSQRLISLLEKAGVKFEAFPVELLDEETSKHLPIDYKTFHLLESYQAIEADNLDKIEFVNPDLEFNPPDKATLAKRPVLKLTKQAIEAKRPFFRLETQPNLVLIHQDLKAELDYTGILGCQYTPIEQLRARPIED